MRLFGLAAIFGIAGCMPVDGAIDGNRYVDDNIVAWSNDVGNEESAELGDVTPDRQESSARWWIVDANPSALFLVDRHSLRSPTSSTREGWTQVVGTAAEGLGDRVQFRVRWDCPSRRATVLEEHLIDPSGARYDAPARNEAATSVPPETPLESELEFACTIRWYNRGFPIPVTRPVHTLATAFVQMYPERVGSIFGLVLLGLDPANGRSEILARTEMLQEPMRSRYRAALLGPR